MSTPVNLFLSVGLPLIVLGISVGVNVTLFVHLSSRLDAAVARIDGRFDLLLSKVVDIDNRLVRVESKLGILP